MSKKERISFSELKIWNECAYKHKLLYIEDLKSFIGNEYTAFGTAMHYLCEKLIVDSSTEESTFTDRLSEEFNLLNIEDSSLLEDFSNQGKKIIPEILPTVTKHFPDLEVVSIEEEIFEDISDLVPESEITNFKGFIDLVLKTPDQKYHIIDWKTCSWGWNREKRQDKIAAYQLVLYKHFFAKKHNVDPSNINTYFTLLKRTAKKDIFVILTDKSSKHVASEENNHLTIIREHISKDKEVNINKSKQLKLLDKYSIGMDHIKLTHEVICSFCTGWLKGCKEQG